jgi:two-component system, chemotaxis family, sensor histidine kinase and response regulator PixL
MAINSDIRDQAYQFFIEEAPELLQAIEAGLLKLTQERNTALVHSIMRAAHSLKGGAASVELDAIALLAHRLETIFKALYSQTIEIDTDLESQLLSAYDCLRLPLMTQIVTGGFDAEQALALAEPIFAQLEERLGDALTEADAYIPSSTDLGVDMTKSIFEVDVAQGLERLAAVVAHPSNYEVAGELRAQAEVFAGFAELLNQPTFGAIAATTLAALKACPERALEITQLALTDFELARQAVLAGNSQAIGPSATLVELADSTSTDVPDSTAIPTAESIADSEVVFAEKENTLSLLEDVFGSTFAAPEMELDSSSPVTAVPEDTQTLEQERELEETFTISLEYGVDSTDITTEADADTDALDFPEILDIEWVDSTTSVAQQAEGETSSLEEVFGNFVATSETEAEQELQVSQLKEELQVERSNQLSNLELSQLKLSAPETLEEAVQSIGQLFDKLPSIQEIPAPKSSSTSVGSSAANPPVAPKAASIAPAQSSSDQAFQTNQAASPTKELRNELNQAPTYIRQTEATPASNLSVRVDSERLEQINNLVGELAINRNGLSLQNEQLQGSVQELLNRFVRVQTMVGDLRKVSDQMLVAPQRQKDETLPPSIGQLLLGELAVRADFDSLELDRYGDLYSRLQGLLEDMMQLEEAVDDIVLFARATDQKLEQQRQMLTHLRDQLMWARMLPLGEVINRFPRMLRDLSATYSKPVTLKLTGTGVLVDKAVLEKLYDPLLHLLRNAFDHGIEPPEIRRTQGKPEQGQIEIRAYHQGSQTIIEVKDDGQGLNLQHIGRRAVEMGFLSVEQLATISSHRLQEFIFEPGFSTKSQVSELSGRGVGLDVVRAQMRSLKGTIAVTSSLGSGSTFTLRLPLTLTIAKLLVGFIGSTAVAIPSDSIEEIVIPKAEQIKQSGTQQYLHWRGQIVPTYRLADLLDYACPVPESSASKALIAVPSPKEWALPMLVIRQDQQFIALEIERLVTEQELVIKPFGEAIAPPNCTYGCTILGDGSLIPVLDTTVLLDQLLKQGTLTTTAFNPRQLSAIESIAALPARENPPVTKPKAVIQTAKAPTVLVVDDAAALRRTLALSLERAGCRVLQARDGREAIEQLQQSASIDLVICDIEMPNMNGFEFLSQRRQDPQLIRIPVVMLTSRSNDKHRWLAMQLGATAYFTKPYLEQEFLGAIKHIIRESTPESLPALQPTL